MNWLLVFLAAWLTFTIAITDALIRRIEKKLKKITMLLRGISKAIGGDRS